MAETVFVSLNNTSWTDISTPAGGVDGYITNRSDDNIFILQRETVPPDTLVNGHRLRPGQNLSFAVGGSEVVFGRSFDDSGEAVVTPGLV